MLWDNATVAEEILVIVTTSNHYYLASFHTLEFYRNDILDGAFRDRVHISKDFGQILPVLLVFNAWAEPVILDTFNDMYRAAI